MKAGEEGWVQIEFWQPVVVVEGDHYILRRPSPPETLGGGVILEAHSPRRYKRFVPEVLEGLKRLSAGNPQQIIVQMIQQARFITEKELYQTIRLDTQLVVEVLRNYWNRIGLWLSVRRAASRE